MKATSIPLAVLLLSSVAAEDICSPETKTFTAKINFYEGQTGYFEFEECPGMVSPTLGMVVNETYTFSQQNVSNWFHPMGFAYGADGALDDQDELEPTITRTSSSKCADSFSCPSPMYHLNGQFLGQNGTDNFGLDDYEPKFFLPLLDWIAAGTFSINVKFDDPDIEQDIFYFCHIHHFMSGRIKILDSFKNPLVAVNTPDIPYEYDTPGEFDRSCGTFGLDEWTLPNKFCPEHFVCNSDSAGSSSLKTFAGCLDAMNCRMMAGITTDIGTDEISLFAYHMIPHHENAVEMARSLLHSGKVDCDDLTLETPECIMQVMVRDIINGQNYQIQTMRSVLEKLGSPATADCDVPFGDGDDISFTSSAARVGFIF